MPMQERWKETGPPLTIEALYAHPSPRSFLHEDIVYVELIGVQRLPEGDILHYLALARDAAMPTKFLGTTVVTPLEPAGLTPLPSVPSPAPR